MTDTSPEPIAPKGADAAQTAAPEGAPYERFSLAVAVAGVLGWLYCALPTRAMPFRVEQWDTYEFYSRYRFNPLSLHDWLLMAFWTPFHDLRFLPGAYLWNYLAYRALGPGNQGLWALSVGLNLANAALVSWWVSLLLRRRDVRAGALAALFYVLFPGRQEIVLWTFFTYKLAASALTLLSLIMLERWAQARRPRDLHLASALLFASWTFYEAGLPLGLLFPLRGLILRDADWKAQALRIARSVAPAYVVYVVLSAAAYRFGPSALDLHGSIPGVNPSPITFLTSLWNWLYHGIAAGSSGLPIVWVSTPFHLYFFTESDSPVLPAVLVGWAMLLAAIDWRRVSWRGCAFVLATACACNGAVWIGRTISNGPVYLACVGMYQHLPALALAALLGVAMGAAPSRAPSRGVFTLLGRIGLVLVTALLLLSSRDAMRGYLRVQAPLRAATAVVEARIAEAHGQPVSVDDVRLPFAPTWAIPSEEHSYHVFHLMFGERIARPRTRGNAP